MAAVSEFCEHLLIVRDLAADDLQKSIDFLSDREKCGEQLVSKLAYPYPRKLLDAARKVVAQRQIDLGYHAEVTEIKSTLQAVVVPTPEDVTTMAGDALMTSVSLLLKELARQKVGTKSIDVGTISADP